MNPSTELKNGGIRDVVSIPNASLSELDLIKFNADVYFSKYLDDNETNEDWIETRQLQITKGGSICSLFSLLVCFFSLNKVDSHSVCPMIGSLLLKLKFSRVG